MIQPQTQVFVLISPSGSGKSWLGNRIQLALGLQPPQFIPESIKEIQKAYSNFIPYFHQDVAVQAKVFPYNHDGVQDVYFHQKCLIVETTPLGQLERLTMSQSAQRIYETVMSKSLVIPQFIYIIDASNQFEGDVVNQFLFFQKLIPRPYLNIYLNERRGQLEGMQDIIIQSYIKKQNLYNKLLQPNNIIEFILKAPIHLKQQVSPHQSQDGFRQYQKQIESHHQQNQQQYQQVNKAIASQPYVNSNTLHQSQVQNQTAIIQQYDNQNIASQPYTLPQSQVQYQTAIIQQQDNQNIASQPYVNSNTFPQSQVQYQTAIIQQQDNQNIASYHFNNYNTINQPQQKRDQILNVYAHGFSSSLIQPIIQQLKSEKIKIFSQFNEEDYIQLCIINTDSLKKWCIFNNTQQTIQDVLNNQLLKCLTCFFFHKQVSENQRKQYQDIKILQSQLSAEAIQKWAENNFDSGKQIVFRGLQQILRDLRII